MTQKAACTHGPKLTRTEAAEHVACTDYGRRVDVRTVDRWANEGLITRYKTGGLQWVSFDRDEITEAAKHVEPWRTLVRDLTQQGEG